VNLGLIRYGTIDRLFGTKCDKCGLQFSKNDFVMRARSKIYHMECFRCVACERQLVPGDEFALREDGLFCKDDHEVLEKAVNGENNMASPPAVTPIHHEASNSGQSRFCFLISTSLLLCSAPLYLSFQRITKNTRGFCFHGPRPLPFCTELISDQSFSPHYAIDSSEDWRD